jgi:hypothetical protein
MTRPGQARQACRIRGPRASRGHATVTGPPAEGYACTREVSRQRRRSVHARQPPRDHVVCEDNRVEGGCRRPARARLVRRKRAELVSALRLCFLRTQTWQHVGRYVSALVGELPRRNGWTIAEHAGGPHALAIGAIDETGQEKSGGATAGVKRQYMGCAGQGRAGAVRLGRRRRGLWGQRAAAHLAGSPAHPVRSRGRLRSPGPRRVRACHPR